MGDNSIGHQQRSVRHPRWQTLPLPCPGVPDGFHDDEHSERRWWTTRSSCISMKTCSAAERVGRHPGRRHAASRGNARRLACDAGCRASSDRSGTVLDIGRRSRTIPSAIRRALWVRDRGCRWPGCHNTRTSTVTTSSTGCRVAAPASTTDSPLQRHHQLVHRGGASIAAAPTLGTLAFRTPLGRELPAVARRPWSRMPSPPSRSGPRARAGAGPRHRSAVVGRRRPGLRPDHLLLIAAPTTLCTVRRRTFPTTS
jgi:hypothetical protein